MKRLYGVGVAAMVLLASCMAPLPSTAPAPGAPRDAPRLRATAMGGPTTSGTSPDGSALAALARLKIKGRAPKTGYARAQFGDRWTDDNEEVWGHNGCDTRDDILRRDLTDVAIRSGGCKVSTGTLHDPYTGKDIAFVRGPATSSLVQIDHVVPLANAWQTGAQSWTARQRRDFANDPLELIAVVGAINEAKSDGDAATWLPPAKGFRCTYAARMVAIKLTWHLWVTPPESDALRRILRACGTVGLPAEPGALAHE